MSRKTLDFEIPPQPDDTTCGPTCLHAIYQYYGDPVPIKDVVAETGRLRGGGTLGVMLATHALRRGYRATIYTYNLHVFDPSWFGRPPEMVIPRLKEQIKHKKSKKLKIACKAYINFLRQGGQIRFEDLNAALIRRYLDRSIPIITGLSATYLYRSIREKSDTNQEDDTRGLPVGHFVVLCGYDRDKHHVLVADPYQPNPLSAVGRYPVTIDRVIGAILLGVITYDANLIILEPG